MTDLPGDQPPSQPQPQDWQPPQDWPPQDRRPQGWQPPPPGYPAYVPQPPLNTYALLSLVLGVMVLPPLGIYFGNKAKEQIAASGERGIELARVGVIVGWILTIVYGLFIVVWCCLAASLFSNSNP
jgi:peptidyl-prolyl cis-trans isomerase B (cyclophilin B)